MNGDPVTLPDGHYAIPDPDDPTRMTYWVKKTTKGRPVFVPWPRGARYGPMATVRRGDLPRNPAKRLRVMGPLSHDQAAYIERVTAAIWADIDAALRRYAQTTVRCCMCGRKLTNPRSRGDCIGPECRREVGA